MEKLVKLLEKAFKDTRIEFTQPDSTSFNFRHTFDSSNFTFISDGSTYGIFRTCSEGDTISVATGKTDDVDGIIKSIASCVAKVLEHCKFTHEHMGSEEISLTELHTFVSGDSGCNSDSNSPLDIVDLLVEAIISEELDEIEAVTKK